MQVAAANDESVAFSYTTTSGKSLNINMFDKQSVAYSDESGSQTLSLRREYGFSFTYQGSKLTEDDLAEIKDAVSQAQPLLEDFLQDSKVKELDPQDFIMNAMNIAGLLPSGDEDAQNATMSALVDSFDALLNKHKSSDNALNTKLLEDSKSLLEKILEQFEKANQENENIKTLLGMYA